MAPIGTTTNAARISFAITGSLLHQMDGQIKSNSTEPKASGIPSEESAKRVISRSSVREYFSIAAEIFPFVHVARARRGRFFAVGILI
jgi:hypothetical protein